MNQARVSGETWALVEDADTLRALMPMLLLQDPIALDTETTGLDHIKDKLRLVQLAVGSGRAVQSYIIDTWAIEDWRSILRPLFVDVRRRFVGHNIRFDLCFLRANGIIVETVYDTMLGAMVLDKGVNYQRRGFFTLAGVVLHFLHEPPLDKTLQRSDWSKPELDREQLEYAARDAALLLPLREVQIKELARENLTRVALIEMRCVPALAWIQCSGMPIQVGPWEELATQAEAERLVAARAIDEHLADALGQRTLFGGVDVGGGLFVGSYDLKVSSTPKLLEALRKLGLRLADTDDASLQAASDEHPVIEHILAWRDAQKRATTYGKSWLAQHVHPVTHRVHADYRQLGSRSGRMSSANPNIQQIPHSKQYRRCFKPTSGYILIKCDYSQIELRLAAIIAPDEAMHRAYATNQDLHRLTASRVLNKSEDAVTDHDRQIAKSLNFGLIYGLGAPGLRSYARASFGVKMSEETAKQYRDAFFAAYPGLTAWHRRTGRNPDPETTLTLTGRKRAAVDTFTQKLNTPVQGSGADGLKIALGRLWQCRAEAPLAQLVACVHDEIVVECPEKDAEAVAAWVRGHMVAGMVEVVGDRIPVDAEAKVSADWSGK